MLLYTAAGIVLICLLIIRAMRAIGFYRDWKGNPQGSEKKAAFWNFVIHLIIILALIGGIYVLASRVYRVKRTQDFYRQINTSRI